MKDVGLPGCCGFLNQMLLNHASLTSEGAMTNVAAEYMAVADVDGYFCYWNTCTDYNWSGEQDKRSYRRHVEGTIP